jgi:cytochrome c oxidase accessory protein FixG
MDQAATPNAESVAGGPRTGHAAGAGAAAAQGVARVEVEPVNKAEARTLYQKRLKIYPKRARGTFRRLKWLIMAVALGVYYLAPWIRWDRGPNAPDQAILLDIPARRFYFFFIEIWPQEVYYLTGILIMSALLLFLATSLFGRVWCGYTCPQTVWTDLFIAVERMLEGDRAARIRLDKAAWSARKIALRVVKHSIWIVIAVMTGGAWVFYYADAPTLLNELVTLQAPMIAYVAIAVLTFTTYTLGGLAREQVCTYMCPWPRIQAAMTDADSFIVTYRDYRGEPRAPHRKHESWEGRGDCIDCNNCVVVCPMGIDIRDGSQLECINCGLCIDACNEVMDRVGRPRGLIAYDNFTNLASKTPGKITRFKLLRVRPMIYAGLMAVVALLMVFGLSTRATLDVNVLRDRNPLFVTLSDGSIRNGYTVKIINKEHAERTFRLSVDGLSGHKISVIGMEDLTGDPMLTVMPDRLASYRVFISAPRADLKGESTSIDFVVTDVKSGVHVDYDAVFRGPKE